MSPGPVRETLPPTSGTVCCDGCRAPGGVSVGVVALFILTPPEVGSAHVTKCGAGLGKGRLVVCNVDVSGSSHRWSWDE